MKTRFWNQLTSVADEFRSPWNSVDPVPSDETDGGGVTPPQPPAPPPTPPAPKPVNGTDDGDEDNLGDAGKRALARIREEKRQVAQELAEAREQIEKLKPYIPPDKYREMIEQNEETKRQARERELELQRQKHETEAEFQTRLIEAEKQRDSERKAREDAEAKAEAERQQRLEFAKRTELSSAFYANDGRDGQDDEGTTYFDLFMKARGDVRTKYDPDTGKTYVIDKEGAIVNGEDGKPLSLAAWMTQLADTNPIIGSLFKPRGGSGGGGLQGARGVRTEQVADVELQRRKRPERLLGEAYGL